MYPNILLNDFEFSRQCLHKNKKYTFKTSKMDQITLECWYNSFLGLLRADGRGFLHQNPILKKVRQTRNQDAAHAQKRVTVPLSIRADWSRIGVEKKLENILDGSLTNLSSSVKWISYSEWLAPKLAIQKISITHAVKFTSLSHHRFYMYKHNWPSLRSASMSGKNVNMFATRSVL